MPAKISLLDETTINQIAAGEVIENPASCIKELLENAVDAKATQVVIETKASGRAYIKVSDNGVGMAVEDLYLSIQRHATSKITNTQDLFDLHTHGFRGEALASMASVSRMLITSASQQGGSAHAIKVEGGKILFAKPAHRQRGTTVEIRDLFYNVPVRKKFAPTLAKEKRTLLTTLENFALSQPHITLRWVADEKEVLCLPSASLPPSSAFDARVEELLGEATFSQLKPFFSEEEGVKGVGYVGIPTAHRATRTGQRLFINGRPIVSPAISSFVQEAYATRIPNNRYPIFLLLLSLPAAWVDVNVHPQKKQVRFTEEKRVEKMLKRGVELAFAKRGQPQVVSLPPSYYNQTPNEVSFPSAPQEPTPSLVTAPLFKEKPAVLALMGRYIFVEGSSLSAYPEMGQSIVVVDQVAARRALYFSSREEGKTPSQRLLLPLTVDLSPKEALALKANQSYLENEGFVFRSLSGNSYAIDALPPTFATEEMSELLERLLEEMQGKKDKERALKLSLCHAIKKRTMTKEEASGVVEKLLQCKDPFFCPLGKPTLKVLSEKEMGRWF